MAIDQLDDLSTPAPIVDLGVMEANIARVAEYARQRNLDLRPHIKTHKSVEIARRQLAAGSAGLTCATLHEAEVMSAVCDDILLAYPPVGPHRAKRVAALAERVRMTVALDSQTVAQSMADAARERGVEVGVVVEMDVGMRRTGVPSIDELVKLCAAVAHMPALRFEGIALYPGHVREHVSLQDEKIAFLQQTLDTALGALQRRGLETRVVSGGSTPMLFRSHEINGLTEIRPGTYVYNDRTTALVEACTMEQCALTVLATVVSTAVAGQAVIDAGTKALGREPLPGGEGGGYGSVMEHPEVIVARMSEEHGMLDLARTSWRPRVGERVRIVPNHVCIVVHLNDLVFGVRGEQVVTSWHVDARGRGAPGRGYTPSH